MTEYTANETQAVEQMGDKVEYDKVFPTPFSERHPCPIEGCRLSAEEHHRLAFGMIAENRDMKRRLAAFEHGGGEPEYQPRPGDRCRSVEGHKVEHVDCDQHPNGTVTDVRTGKVVSR